MSSSHHIYVGPYVKVTVPVITKENFEASCPNESCSQHGKWLRSSYCAECGSKIGEVSIKKNYKVDLHDLMETHLHNIDLFMAVSLGKNIECCIPNQKGQGGILLHEEDGNETPIPDLNFTHPDWDRLTKMLDEQKIAYEKKAGIIEWWW